MGHVPNIDIESPKIDCLSFVYVPATSAAHNRLLFCFFLLWPFTVLMKKTHAVKLSIILRCLWCPTLLKTTLLWMLLLKPEKNKHRFLIFFGVGWTKFKKYLKISHRYLMLTKLLTEQNIPHWSSVSSFGWDGSQ